ncbi:MAG: peptidyl-prolyl cis-trans isomerase [Polyangiaceae bacterium]
MNRILFLGGGALAIALSAYITVASFKDVPAAGSADGGAVVLANFDASVVVEKPLPVPVLDFDAAAVPPAPTSLTAPSLLGDGGIVESTTGDRKSVRFGVVLVTFAGAQDAPSNARPKAAAKALADKLAAEAKTSFHDAVNHGDPGSIDDAGRMHRGVLEAEAERVLFGLGAGEISEPIEVPRGYWIVKRLD